MFTRRTLLAISGAFCFCLLLLGLVLGFVPQDEGVEIRRAVRHSVVTLTGEDIPLSIESCGDGERLWALRTIARMQEKKEEAAVRTEPDLACVRFSPDEIVLVLGGENHAFGQTADPGVLVPLLALDGFSVPSLMGVQPIFQGEAMDSEGAPLRWYLERTLQAGYTPLAMRRSILSEPKERKNSTAPDVRILTVPTRVYRVQGSGLARALAFKPLVDSFSKSNGLDPTLVNAIIYSESNFNTGLVSRRSAVGLMQVLPTTAGGDIHRFLHGRSAQVSSQQLFDPELNIKYGTAYLRILRDRYFGEVRDPLSREYCMVAAYNMGPNRVIRLFGANPSEAARFLNSLSSEEVYQALVSRLPKQETRNYVAKVRSLKQQYRQIKGK